MKTVSVIGGGTGSFHVLSGLRDCDVYVQSIVSMMDSGGDSGELRDAFGVLPPGDLRRCLVALSEESELLRDLFAFRFDEPPLQGRNFGNLFILALTKALGSEKQAIGAITKILKIRGRVLPVTWDHVHLCAELANGDILRGEASIDGRGSAGLLDGVGEPLAPIQRAFLEPEATANPYALEVIARSDVIVYAPGDIFTSTVPNLLVKGVSTAIRESRAPLIYVVNLMTKHGETDGWSASRHVKELAEYGGRVPDAVLIHEGDVPRHLLDKYEAENASRVVVDVDQLRDLGVTTIRFANIMSTTSFVRHDPERTAQALMQLFEELSGRHEMLLSGR
ncbi:MAG: YvcK family protein [Acidobacteria bacterium]|nr:YvcK family protein [Acidobacteriota bacterium]